MTYRMHFRQYLAVVRLLLSADRDQLPMLFLNGLALPATLAYFLERLANGEQVRAAVYAKTFTLCLSASMVQLGYAWLQDRGKRNRELLQTVQPSAWIYTSARMTIGILGAVLLYACLLVLGDATLFSFSFLDSFGVLLIVAVASLSLCALAALIVESVSGSSKSTTMVIWASLVLVGVSPVLWQVNSGPAWISELQQLVPHGVLLNALRALLSPGAFPVGALLAPATILLASGLLLCVWVVRKCTPRRSSGS